MVRWREKSLIVWPNNVEVPPFMNHRQDQREHRRASNKGGRVAEPQFGASTFGLLFVGNHVGRSMIPQMKSAPLGGARVSQIKYAAYKLWRMLIAPIAILATLWCNRQETACSPPSARCSISRPMSLI